MKNAGTRTTNVRKKKAPASFSLGKAPLLSFFSRFVQTFLIGSLTFVTISFTMMSRMIERTMSTMLTKARAGTRASLKSEADFIVPIRAVALYSLL